MVLRYILCLVIVNYYSITWTIELIFLAKNFIGKNRFCILYTMLVYLTSTHKIEYPLEIFLNLPFMIFLNMKIGLLSPKPLMYFNISNDF